jgi:hypothetical protein
VTGDPPCEYPRYEPSKANPSGGHGAPAVMAAPLGDTGRWLPLCAECAAHRADAVPLASVPDR